MANDEYDSDYGLHPLSRRFGMSSDQYARAKRAFLDFIGRGDKMGSWTGGLVAPHPQMPWMQQQEQRQPQFFGSPLFAHEPAPNTTVVPKGMPTEELPPLPTKKPKKGKESATLDLADPIVIDAAGDPKAMVAAIESAGNRPVLVKNAMAIGMGSDNVVVAGQKAKADPAKVARSIQTPVVSRQGFVDVLSYIRGAR